jgi:nucleotide-binding universal stress UspA family protein
MRIILIPVDFSATSKNVLRYAAAFVKDAAAERIILLKSRYISVYAQLLPSADYIQLNAADIEAERQEKEKQLKFIAQKLLRQCHFPVKVETAISELPLLRAIRQVIEQERPDLLLTGSDAAAPDGYSSVGAEVISIAKTSSVPVMIIPASVPYHPITKAVVPCDFAAFPGWRC